MPKTMIYNTQIKQYIKDERNRLQSIETIDGKKYPIHAVVIHTNKKLHLRLIDSLRNIRN